MIFSHMTISLSSGVTLEIQVSVNPESHKRYVQEASLQRSASNEQREVIVSFRVDGDR